jgi:hypothetical protein
MIDWKKVTELSTTIKDNPTCEYVTERGRAIAASFVIDELLTRTMDVKILEIRDEGTLIPAIAFRLNPKNEAERFLLGYAGFGSDPKVQREGYVFLARLKGGDLNYDLYNWGGSRTMKTAHWYIKDHFDTLEPGQVVDVQHILKEKDNPSRPTREEIGSGLI